MELSWLQVKDLGVGTDYGVDRIYYLRARKLGKQVACLESPEVGMGHMTDLSREEADEMLRGNLEQLDRERENYVVTCKEWKEGRWDRLEVLMRESEMQSPRVYKKLGEDRNRAWLPKIESLLDCGTNSMVIVGYSHLVGKESLIEMLRKKGKVVTQL